jgi:serine protease Do
MSKKTLLTAVVLVLFGIVLGSIISARIDMTPITESSNITEEAKSNDFGTIWGKSFVAVTKKVNPTVVTILSEKKAKPEEQQRSRQMPDFFNGPNGPFDDFFGPFHYYFGPGPQRELPQRGLGSGVIVSQDGYILTNNHVVSEADEIKVQLQDNKEYDAKIIGTDEKSDIAVIKIDVKDLPYATLGDSDKLDVGEIVLAIGNPMGLNHTVTMGIVSAIGRNSLLQDVTYQDFIQTDAAINPGNSGGALINTNGEVIGINTAIASRDGYYQGYGFAIPSNMAKHVMESLIKTGKVDRGFIGVGIQNIDSSIAKAYNLKSMEGAIVNDVYKDSPGEKAGLKKYDVIIELNKEKIKNVGELQRKVSSTPPGDKIKLKVLREGKEIPIEVTLTNLDKFDTSDIKGINNLIGLEAKAGISGVVISDVVPGGPADSAGLRQGDQILEIDKNKINDINDYQNSMKNIKVGDTILFLIKRGSGQFLVAIEIDK